MREYEQGCCQCHAQEYSWHADGPAKGAYNCVEDEAEDRRHDQESDHSLLHQPLQYEIMRRANGDQMRCIVQGRMRVVQRVKAAQAVTEEWSLQPDRQIRVILNQP